jgi:hypothetical protein
MRVAPGRQTTQADAWVVSFFKIVDEFNMRARR